MSLTPINEDSALYPSVDQRPDENILDNEDLVESRMDDFIKMRLSQMTEKERRLAQSMIGGRNKIAKGDEDPLERDKDLFKISKKEDEYFTKMSDQEQMRLYTTLHDQNTRLKDHIKALKKEFMTLLQKLEGREMLDMENLQGDNKVLREELRQLTLKTDRDANTKMLIPAKQKKLLQAYGGNNRPVDQPALTYTDKKMLQTKIDELKGSYQIVEKKVKECHDLMNKAGIRNVAVADSASPSTIDIGKDKSPKELQMLIAQMESKLESLSAERDIILSKTKAVDEAIKTKHHQLQQAIDDNIDKEQRYIAIRSRDPVELQSEIRQIKAREIELTNRIRSLQNLPMYKNDSGAQALIKLKEAESITIDLKGQLATEEEINQRKQKEVDALKKEIEGLRIEKQNARKDLSRAKAMYEGMVQYQQNAMYNQPLPTMQLNEIKSGKQQKADQGEFNEKLIRTLGLIRWQGEEPAWYKLQFLERAKKINPNDREALRQEYTRLLIGKKELSERLNKVEGVLKITAEHEKKKEEDHLLLKKKKENELMRLEETRKDLESTLDRVGVGAGKVFIGKNQRTGQDVFYNDGISVFSMDQSDMFRINMEENLLDIYLDKLDLEPEMVISALEAVQVAGVYPQNLVSIMAVNFFNHPTLTSQKCFGTQAEIKLQSTFAFRCDGFFIEYCKKNTLDVDVFFTNEHGALVKFAIAQLDLNKLIEVNMADKRDDYIGVVKTFARVYTLGHQHIGILTFRMKTRLPIYRDLLAYNSMHRGATGGPHTTYDSKHLNTERYLNIKVCNGYGFSTYAKTFVTYRFMSTGETVTKAVEGANPRFDEVRQFPLMYTQGVSEYLKNEVVEFTVMDDSIPFRQPGSEGLRDVIGSGMVHLLPLTFDKPIVEKVYLKDMGTGRVKGSIFVKIFWDGLEMPEHEMNEFNRAWEDGISRRVIGEIKRRKLTLRGVFNIGDQDNQAGLSKEEFKNVVLNLLGVELSPVEYNEYWNRVHRGSNSADVSFERVLTYYGNLLDAEILGKGTMRQDINDVNRFFKSGDQSLTGPDTTEMGYLLQMFSEDLSRIKKERKMKDYDIFKAYDQDKNQRVSLAEFKTVSETLKAKTPPADLDKIFAYLDKNGSGSIDLAELFKVLSFDINEYYKEQSMNKSQSDPNSIENWKSERIILEFMKLVEDYMRRTGSSIYQIYAQMDKKPDSQVDRREITVFIREKMAIKSFPDGHLNVVLNTIDKDVDRKITMREFVEFLKLRDVYRMVNSEKEREEMRELKVMRVLYDLMYVTDKTPIDLIHEIDTDKSGTIDPVELAFYVKDLKGDIATHDIDKFMHYVDKNVSNSLEMKEVENALQAYILLMDQERDVPNEQIEALLAKLIPIIDNNKSKLKEMMVILSDKHNSELIKEENMRKILEGSRLFREVEIDMIINPICSPFTTFRKIRYNNFFDLKKHYARHLKMKESGLGIRRGKVLVDQLFKVLKKVGKKHHLNEYELFQCFDTDDSGSVTLTEMKRNLSDMKIDLTEDQFGDIMKSLDRNGDGKITFYEFKDYLRQVEI